MARIYVIETNDRDLFAQLSELVLTGPAGGVALTMTDELETALVEVRDLLTAEPAPDPTPASTPEPTASPKPGGRRPRKPADDAPVTAEREVLIAKVAEAYNRARATKQPVGKAIAAVEGVRSEAAGYAILKDARARGLVEMVLPDASGPISRTPVNEQNARDRAASAL